MLELIICDMFRVEFDRFCRVFKVESFVLSFFVLNMVIRGSIVSFFLSEVRVLFVNIIFESVVVIRILLILEFVEIFDVVS